MPAPIPVFITSRNRGLYLWACLDSLFKYTRYPCLFVIGDNSSDDPLVYKVIEGFQRRQMLHRVFLRDVNEPDLMEFLLRENRDLVEAAKYFASIESDVMVLPHEPCWLTQYVALMEANEKLAMLGSLIDQTDFISLEQARVLAPNQTDEQLIFLTKSNSPERALEKKYRTLIKLPAPDWPYNPPGRLLIRRTEAVRRLFDFKVAHMGDRKWHEAFVAGGYETGIAADVPHRHLSLLNAFDYPEYDNRLRDWYFLHRKKEMEPPA